MCPLTVLEAVSPRSRCQRGRLLLEVLVQVSLLASGGCQPPSVFSWLVDTSLQSPPLSHLGGLPVYLLKSPLPMRTPGIGVRTHGTPVGPYLDCICNDPITVIFTGTGPLGMNIFWGGGHESIHNRDGAVGSKEAFLQSGKGREWASAGARLGMSTSPVKAAHRLVRVGDRPEGHLRRQKAQALESSLGAT